jgi:hypothetical protein
MDLQAKSVPWEKRAIAELYSCFAYRSNFAIEQKRPQMDGSFLFDVPVTSPNTREPHAKSAFWNTSFFVVLFS